MAYLETDSPVNVGNGGYGNGFMNGDGFWAIILLAIIFGWGGNGYGFGGGRQSASGVMDGYVLTSDFASIERKLDNVNSGLCDGFYAMNTGMLNGFAGVTNAITTGGYDTRNAISDLSAQLASCCCNTQSAIKDTQFAIATQTNALQQSLCTGFRDVIDNNNANTRSILDFLVKDKIDTLTAENQGLRLKASQTEQNSYLISQLRPTAIPAYLTCSPYQSVCGCGTTCGQSIV
nr:MAG TPA: hypothetical protein [Caudoviricetes sp.]